MAGIIKEVGEGVAGLHPATALWLERPGGGFAEEALGFDFNTHVLPDEVSFADASAILMTHGTVIHALKDRAELKAGETLVVLGASGGVGTAAIQLGKMMGAHVIALTSSEEKKQFCTAAGADEAHTYNTDNLKALIKEVTQGKGANVIFDPIGGDFAEQAFRGIAPQGRYLVIGFAEGTVPSIPLNLPLLKSASIVGTFWGSFFRYFPEENKKNISQLLDWVRSGTLKPIVDEVFPLEATAQAIQKLQHRNVKGKVLVQVAD